MNKALEMQRNIGGQLGPILIKMGFMLDDGLTSFMARQEGMDWLDISQLVIPQALVNTIPREAIEKHQLIPVHRVKDTITVAVSDPLDIEAVDEVQFLTGKKIEMVLASKEQIRRSISRFYYEGGAREVLLGDLSDEDGAVPQWKMKRALIPLLIEKGLITEEELIERARSIS